MDNLEYVKELLKELSDFSHAQTVTLVPVNPAEFLTTVLSGQEKQVKKYVPHVFPAGFPDSPECFSDRIKQWSEIPRDVREQE